MYNNCTRVDCETFKIEIPKNREFRILQLTDLHLGFSPLSKALDELALAAVRELVGRAGPDLIVLTGDSVFPFFPLAGTVDNRMQARRLTEFMDGFGIPYTLVFGNHDSELFSRCGKEELAELFMAGEYCLFTPGPRDLSGVGNFIIELVEESGKPLLPLVLLDSNMYCRGKWFFSGFDGIHADQTDWCMARLEALMAENPDIKAMAFFHMPPREFKEAYEKMKLGDRSVIYRHGSIAEKDEYFGISKYKSPFFDRAVENGVIKWMFCGHDHLNTLSLVYKGIQLTYGMSIDYLSYKNIKKSYIQRGGTLISRRPDGAVDIKMLPLGPVVSTRVRGVR